MPGINIAHSDIVRTAQNWRAQGTQVTSLSAALINADKDNDGKANSEEIEAALNSLGSRRPATQNLLAISYASLAIPTAEQSVGQIGVSLNTIFTKAKEHYDTSRHTIGRAMVNAIYKDEDKNGFLTQKEIVEAFKGLFKTGKPGSHFGFESRGYLALGYALGFPDIEYAAGVSLREFAEAALEYEHKKTRKALKAKINAIKKLAKEKKIDIQVDENQTPNVKNTISLTLGFALVAAIQGDKDGNGRILSEECENAISYARNLIILTHYTPGGNAATANFLSKIFTSLPYADPKAPSGGIQITPFEYLTDLE